MEIYWSLLCISCLSVWLLPVSGTRFGAGPPNTLEYKNASIGNLASGNASRNREEVWLYKYAWIDKTKPHAVRITVKSETATEQFPLLFVARLQRGVISWSIPDERYNYHLASRTLCPFLHGFIPLAGLETNESFSIDVSTASPKLVNYTLKAEFAENFLLSLSDPLTVTVDPAQPKYFLWRYPDNVDTVLVRAESKDVKLCAILSIQGTQCPVYDLARNVEFTGHFQTMTTKAAITMERSRFDQSEFYVVLIVKSSDEECVSGERFAEPHTEKKAGSRDSYYAGPLSQRQKTIKITVERTLSSKDYVKAIVVPIAFFASFYVIAFGVLLATWCRQKGGRERSFRSILMPKDTDIQDGLSINRPLRTSSSRRSRDHYGSTPQGTDLAVHHVKFTTTSEIDLLFAEHCSLLLLLRQLNYLLCFLSFKVYSSFAFWTTFSIIHIFGCLYLSSQIYYMGRVKFDAGMFSRIFVLLRYDCCSCPIYKDRMLLLVIANAVNWVFAIYGVATTPNDFATYLLAILIVNGLLYLAFYVIMKVLVSRIVLFTSYCYITFLKGKCSAVINRYIGYSCTILEAFLLFSPLQKSPAQSREGNKDCILLGFYDAHDVWHFLSACALFLSFLGLLTLDDDLLRTPRSNIPVF
ncbi:SID1 transmembrane family member 2-like [Orbicella faveolata]|uniref:SID1 transmembrane family member 2-like n=1 Tax=Orbicella faveolata TaxID=48498 RepID=UPI0009E5F6B7|nr:SID1 transmembrane family member 2-like [Orbicella faveolata]